MPYVVTRGDTLLIPSGTLADPNKKHLFIVLTKECNGGEHLLVSISTVRPSIFHDPTCLISAGEHPFVTVPSFVEYRMARTIDAAHICKCVDGWEFMKKEPATGALLKRICDGVLVSKFVPTRILNYFNVNASP